MVSTSALTRYAILDFESNGLSPAKGGRLLEIAVVLVESGRIVASRHSLLNPQVPVPPYVTTLTGITASMVRAAPPPSEVLPGLLAFIGDAALVMHNASIDRQFWLHEMALAGLKCPQEFICTLRIARRLYPWARGQKLSTLAELHGIPVETRHQRALAEAMTTARLFVRMSDDLAALYAPEAVNAAFLARYQKTGKALAKSAPVLSPHERR